MASPQTGSITDLEEMALAEKITFLKGHKDWKCNVRWELRDEHKDTWQTNGLSNLTYQVTDKRQLETHTEIITVDVLLNGEHQHDEVAGQNSNPHHFKKLL